MDASVAGQIARYRRRIVATVAYALATVGSRDPEPAQIAEASPYAVALIDAGAPLIDWWIAQSDESIESARPVIDVIVESMLAAYRRPAG